MGCVGNRREHLIRIAELGCDFEHFRVVQQRAIEHPVGVDNEPIVDAEARVEH
jgi:hypothetical protein